MLVPKKFCSRQYSNFRLPQSTLMAMLKFGKRIEGELLQSLTQNTIQRVAIALKNSFKLSLKKNMDQFGLFTNFL